MTSTVVSWGLTICLVGAAVYVYRPDLLKSVISQTQETKANAPEQATTSATKKSKPKKGTVAKVLAGEKADSASDSQSSKKRKIALASQDKKDAAQAPAVKPQQQQSGENENENDLTDKDFAAQLAQTQSGTKLQVPPKQQPSKKERRASRLAATSSPDPSGLSTDASSTTGRDADDDLTPSESPERQSIPESTSKAGDVSDMLEAPAARPTTLRLTSIPGDAKPKKPTNKAFEPVLSKKKRNEQQRKEEQRLAREEADRIHEKKKQEQLARARTAAGTSNQIKANNFAAKANAWQTGAPDKVKSPSGTATEPLLDTFEPITSRSVHGAVHTETTQADSANDLKQSAGENTAAAMTASSAREGLSPPQRQEYTSTLAEEDQEDAWESVTTKKGKKKGKQDADSTSGASSPVRAVPVPVKSQINGNKTNGLPKKPETANRFDSFQLKTSGLQNSDWEA